MMGLLAGADFAHGDGAVDEAVGPGAVDVEETDGFVGEEAVVGDEVIEGNADQQAEVGEEQLHVGRHLRLGLGGVELDGAAEAFLEGGAGLDPWGAHCLFSRLSLCFSDLAS
jgi:hypothetical protein